MWRADAGENDSCGEQMQEYRRRYKVGTLRKVVHLLLNLCAPPWSLLQTLATLQYTAGVALATGPATGTATGNMAGTSSFTSASVGMGI